MNRDIIISFIIKWHDVLGPNLFQHPQDIIGKITTALSPLSIIAVPLFAQPRPDAGQT